LGRGALTPPARLQTRKRIFGGEHCGKMLQSGRLQGFEEASFLTAKQGSNFSRKGCKMPANAQQTAAVPAVSRTFFFLF
jgi:hypothetical protein